MAFSCFPDSKSQILIWLSSELDAATVCIIFGQGFYHYQTLLSQEHDCMIYMALMELADIDLPFCILNELLEWSLDSHKEDTTDYT